MPINWKDSTVYCAIFEDGRKDGVAQGALHEARGMLLLIGARRCGLALEEATATVWAMTDRARLERMTVRALDVTTWDEILATP